MDTIELMLRSTKLILLNYQPTIIPQQMSYNDWELWMSDRENTVISKTYFLERRIEVSTVFLPIRTYNNHQFETIVFIDGDARTEYRWESWSDAWIMHMILSHFEDMKILKLTN